MPNVNDRSINRILDANFNRTKEGLRVCEDLCRFVYQDRNATRCFKEMRHELADIFLASSWKDVIAARDVDRDIGRGSIGREMRRKDAGDVLFANLQRVKESVRVLEELIKLRSATRAQQIKDMRYRIYRVERKIAGKF